MDKAREILVAGSAGRGSTAAMIAAILTAAGESVVLADHGFIHSPRERLSLNATPLSGKAADANLGDDAALETEIERVVESAHPSWVIRSGLPSRAGRVDLAVFTPVLPEGRSAAEHAGEIVAGLPPATAAVSTLQRESVLDVLRPAFPNLVELATTCRLSRGQTSIDGQEFRLRTALNEYRVRLQVLGAFQVENAATAILAAEQLAAGGVSVSPATTAAALADLRLPARCEIVKRQPLIVADAGSNALSIRRVCETFQQVAGGRRMTLILDLNSAPSPVAALEAMTALRADLIATFNGTSDERFELQRAAGEQDRSIQFAANSYTAIEAALASAGPRDAILIAGSRQAAASARAQTLGLTPPGSGLPYTGT